MQVGRFVRWGLCLGLLTVPSFAGIVLDFSGAGAGSGSISGNATTATGSNILIDTLNAIGTPMNAGSYTVTGGSLSFSATGGSYAGGGIYDYTGGTYTITGTVSGVPGASGTLLNGVISSLIVNLTTGQVEIANGSDSKSTALLEYFVCASGTCPNTWNFVSGTTHLTNEVGPGVAPTYNYSASTFSTDVPNDYVPEPASIVLLGTIVVGITQSIRRRGSKTTA